MLDADIEACFDRIDHAALMDRVRMRVKDKRVLALVKAFLKAGLMTELGERNETASGTPQGGILSPLLTHIALSVLDDFAAEQWETAMATRRGREQRRRRGLPTWRSVRYADDAFAPVGPQHGDLAALLVGQAAWTVQMRFWRSLTACSALGAAHLDVIAAAQCAQPVGLPACCTPPPERQIHRISLPTLGRMAPNPGVGTDPRRPGRGESR